MQASAMANTLRRSLLFIFLSLLCLAAVQESPNPGTCLLEVKDGPFDMRCNGSCSVINPCPETPYTDPDTWRPTKLHFCNCVGGDQIWCMGTAVKCQTFVAEYDGGVLIAACVDCGCGTGFPNPPDKGKCERSWAINEEWHSQCSCPN